MKSNLQRPKFLNLLVIRLPITGITSIYHRVSGVFLFLSIPFSLFLLQYSLQDKAGFEQVGQWLNTVSARVVLFVLLWAYLHHLFAGIRFLLIDQNIGTSLPVARKSAATVLFAAIVAALMLGGNWLL